MVQVKAGRACAVCTKPASGRLCEKCAGALASTSAPPPSPTPAEPPAPTLMMCSVCGVKAIARGLCNKHWQNVRRAIRNGEGSWDDPEFVARAARGESPAKEVKPDPEVAEGLEVVKEEPVESTIAEPPAEAPKPKKTRGPAREAAEPRAPQVRPGVGRPVRAPASTRRPRRTPTATSSPRTSSPLAAVELPRGVTILLALSELDQEERAQLLELATTRWPEQPTSGRRMEWPL